MTRTLSSTTRIGFATLLIGLGGCFATAADGDDGEGEARSDEAALAAGLVAGEQTIFDTAVPKVSSDPDSAAVELGVKFRSKVAGKVTGLRFYKGAGNGGTHVGSLWSASGARLASVTFTNETASGWQLARFSTPVTVTPNTTYVASYHAPQGHYAGDNRGLAQSRTAGALTALGDGVDGPNGLYRYGASGRPTSSYLASNYFVDVVFRADTAPVADGGTSTPDSGTNPPPDSGTRAPYGWQLTAATTGLAGAGVDRNTLPVFTGTITAGMTLSKVRINRTLDLSKIANVTLDRVWLRPSDGRTALTVGPGTVIKDSDVDGSDSVQGERIGLYSNTTGTYAVQRVAITKVSIGAWLDGSGTGSVSDTYVHDLISINGAHVDGFTRRAGTGPLTIARSRIDCSGGYVTGAFFLQDTWGAPIANVKVEDTYLEGEGYVFTLDNRGSGVSFSAKNVRVRAVGWGPMTTGGAITFAGWSDVYTYDASKLPGAQGKAINRP